MQTAAILWLLKDLWQICLLAYFWIVITALYLIESDFNWLLNLKKVHFRDIQPRITEKEKKNSICACFIESQKANFFIYVKTAKGYTYYINSQLCMKINKDNDMTKVFHAVA